MNFVVFSFDGTGNEPEDASQSVKFGGKRDDDNISNVLKLHLMLGGNLFAKGTAEYGHSTQAAINQAFYYQGVGTYGSWLTRWVNQGLAPERCDVASILRKSMDDFHQHVLPHIENTTILVTGFSRGAALARRFATLVSQALEQKHCKPPSAFMYLCVWDTVASIGLPNMSTSSRPDYDVVFEDGYTLSDVVTKAVHMISLDDKRRAFQPTLMNYDADRVLELWFAGAHSDVGGGYYRDGLSDITLSFALKWLVEMHQQTTEHDYPLPFLDLSIPTNEALEKACPQYLDGMIGMDDLRRNPDPMAKNHQQDRFFLVELITMDDRRCCVINQDKIDKSLMPIVHWSVPVRIYRDQDYNPKSLHNVKHKVWYDFVSQMPSFEGIQAHEEFAHHNWTLPEKGETVLVSVEADMLFNHTGVRVIKGENYKIKVLENQVWYDRKQKCDATGWDRAGVKMGIKEVAICVAEPFRRVSDANWFCLCGGINTDEDSYFKIALGVDYTPAKTGELTLFANDLESKYGNNWGAIKVEITRL